MNNLLLVTKNNTSVKAALRQAGYSADGLEVMLAHAQVTEAEG